MAWSTSGVAPWPSWLDRSRWGYLREVRSARRLAELALTIARQSESRVRCIIERHSLFSDAALRLSEKLGVPHGIEVNAPLVLERTLRGEPLWQPHGTRWERETLRRAHRITTVSRWLRCWLIEEIGVEPERVLHVPNGTSPWIGARGPTRERLGFHNDSFVLGFIGSHQPWHGLDVLSTILDRIPDARLLLVGADREGFAIPPGPLHRHSARVHAAGVATEALVADLVAAMDVGLAPYPANAPPWFCPLKILDYRAQGTPVVSTRVGENEQLVGGSGTIVTPDNVDEMCEAVLSWRGRRCPPSPRTWEQVAAETRNFILSS